MTELTERLLGDVLKRDWQQDVAYHNDAQHHAEFHAFRNALDLVHRALIEVGEQHADQVVTLLAKGLPDPADTKQRMDQMRRDVYSRSRFPSWPT